MIEDFTIHKKEFIPDKGWQTLCNNDYYMYATIADNLVSCEHCLEIMIKRKGGTFEEWQEKVNKTKREAPEVRK